MQYQSRWWDFFFFWKSQILKIIIIIIFFDPVIRENRESLELGFWLRNYSRNATKLLPHFICFHSEIPKLPSSLRGSINYNILNMDARSMESSCPHLSSCSFRSFSRSFFFFSLSFSEFWWSSSGHHSPQAHGFRVRRRVRVWFEFN